MPGRQSPTRGRPLELNRVVRYREVQGEQVPVTAGEQVIERRGLGLDDQAAADSAGINRTTLHHWRLGGARARAIEAQGLRELTPDEQDLRDFVNGLERAEAEWEASRLAIIQRAAQGGYQVSRTVEKWVAPTPGAAPVLVERVVTTTTARPEWQAAAWQLERLRRDKYARRWEVTGADGAPLIPEQDQARNLADSLRAYQAEQAKKAPATPRAHRPRTRTPTEGTKA